MTYTVYVESRVSESVEVDACGPAEAIEAALGEADVPNCSNKFEPSGDPEAYLVYDDNGDVVWIREVA